jgi:hypothetical protein
VYELGLTIQLDRLVAAVDHADSEGRFGSLPAELPRLGRCNLVIGVSRELSPLLLLGHLT